MFKPGTMKTASLILALMGLGMLTGLYTARYYQPEPESPDIEGLFWPDPKQLHDFSTIDHTGRGFGLDRLKGQWSFLFFGYTHCPDICPVTLSVMDRVQQELERRGVDNARTVFITVDPGRDTTEQLAQYVGYFNPDFIGLGGSEAQIRSLTRQIGVVSSRGEPSKEGEYLVDHSASLFLIDPRGRLISLFSAPHKANAIVSRFMAIRRFLGQQA